MQSCTSSSVISRSADTIGCTPRLSKPRTCPPVTPRYTLRISTSAMCSASTIACRMSSSASDVSAISPLRTPRERAWPSPMMFKAPSAFSSPTTAHTFDVPTSNPTMIEEGSNMFLFSANRFRQLGGREWNRAGLQPPSWIIVADRQIERPDCFVLLLRGRKYFMPSAQLLLDVPEAKSNLAPLPRCHDQHVRCRCIYTL